MKKEIVEWIKSIAFALVVVYIFQLFFMTTVVYNTSMYPTLVEKDVLFMVRTHEVEKGDIVTFKSDIPLTERDRASISFLQKIFLKDDAKKNLIKRVIATPGDSIMIEEGVVYLNGVEINEPFISSFTTHDVEEFILDEDEYFMMGDNRSASKDSRYPDVGPIDEEEIMAKALFRIFPLGKMGKIDK